MYVQNEITTSVSVSVSDQKKLNILTTFSQPLTRRKDRRPNNEAETFHKLQHLARLVFALLSAPSCFISWGGLRKKLFISFFFLNLKGCPRGYLIIFYLLFSIRHFIIFRTSKIFSNIWVIFPKRFPSKMSVFHSVAPVAESSGLCFHCRGSWDVLGGRNFAGTVPPIWTSWSCLRCGVGTLWG